MLTYTYTQKDMTKRQSQGCNNNAFARWVGRWVVRLHMCLCQCMQTNSMQWCAISSTATNVYVLPDLCHPLMFFLRSKCYLFVHEQHLLHYQASSRQYERVCVCMYVLICAYVCPSRCSLLCHQHNHISIASLKSVVCFMLLFLLLPFYCCCMLFFSQSHGHRKTALCIMLCSVMLCLFFCLELTLNQRSIYTHTHYIQVNYRRYVCVFVFSLSPFGYLPRVSVYVCQLYTTTNIKHSTFPTNAFLFELLNQQQEQQVQKQPQQHH